MSRGVVDLSGSLLIIYLQSKPRKHVESIKKRNEANGIYALLSEKCHKWKKMIAKICKKRYEECDD